MRARPEFLTYVGKESNKVQEVESGLAHDPDEVYTEYTDQHRDPWHLIVPLLQGCNLSELATKSGITARQLRNLASRKDRPRKATRQRILEALRGMDLDEEAVAIVAMSR